MSEVKLAFCACGYRMEQTYRGMQFISTEFRRVCAFDPKTKGDHFTRGGHFDLGLGAWVGDKNDRKRIMRDKGLREITADEASGHVDRDYAMAYRKRIAAEGETI